MSSPEYMVGYNKRRKAQRRLLAHNRAVLSQPALLTDRLQPIRRPTLRLKKR